MSTKDLFLAAVMFTITGVTLAQNRPAPEYLLTQNFPDSVNSTILYSLDGQQIEFSQILKEYEGSIIVLDFWASWCKDCIITIPEYNMLRNKVKNKNVVFILLSVDKEESKWKSAISKFDIKGKHYRFELGWKNPLSTYVDLDWIPRYIVLNEQGKIIKPKSIHIDDEEFTNALIQSSNK